ncbi:hypothetical protein [Pseudoalteromonas luteoviolacea]|uniref:Uncharacterized protein n=1 Tax=Pseudoalteromonas luteoviolacea DSM 6061 TaxID=1365250 RepID=A0A166XHV1_9GAMM|nr:hypothetical protein [Pseudoalteromonas luteoviolacea]KZN40341.1 hypothetical protein N475_12810 [Pseudoalteromonas luteoviolacea DSM 6061]KZN57305.1 hypothetical protein N474_08880 [Pseudoalteromonas luteoviolacea CPMOR-2]MBE0387876.1 hypothetical protein [Pseudoalteromonas luteoviolacea DSM 6061]
MKVKLKKREVKQLSLSNSEIKAQETMRVAGGIKNQLASNYSWTVVTSHISDCPINMR